MSQDTNQTRSGQEGTTGNDRGMSDNRHSLDRDHGTMDNGTTGVENSTDSEASDDSLKGTKVDSSGNASGG